VLLFEVLPLSTSNGKHGTGKPPKASPLEEFQVGQSGVLRFSNLEP